MKLQKNIVFENIQKGLLTELQCQLDFSYYGILLSQPIVNDSRYDFIADIDGKLYKIQCKTCVVTEDGNAISIKTCSVNGFTNKKRDYQNEIDFFYTSYDEQGYLIPIEDVPGNSITIRFAIGNHNANNTNIHWAEPYLFDNIIKTLTNNFHTPFQSVVLKREKKSNKKCIDCGIGISTHATRCEKCNALFVKERNKALALPSTKLQSRDELKDLIRHYSFSDIAKQFGCSDNAVRKWCDKYNLPRTKKEINQYSNKEWEEV